MACFLYLMEIGVDKRKIELWHHDVDGEEGSNLMDWPVTKDYCRKFAQAFNVPIYFSWRIGGFEAEMLRENRKTNPVKFEVPGGEVHQAGGKGGKESTRMKFPQVSADLSVRWCSAYLKIDVGSLAINNQERFSTPIQTEKGPRVPRILVLSGERAQESTARAKYKTFEPDRCNGKKRTVSRWRPIHSWDEERVWDIISKYRVVPHPAYYLGWGRLSCKTCIFGSPNQWASCREIDPEGFKKIADYEKQFEKTIHRSKTVDELADKGTPYNMPEKLKKLAMSKEYNVPIIVPRGKKWKQPAGAFGESNGPT